ncbi:MAG: anthranilate phosphoribosyltransferase [Planctomycetaceae bacterium]|nr:anthranilate phosphoribosyltransferase [Planctomycetaceae bacterium]
MFDYHFASSDLVSEDIKTVTGRVAGGEDLSMDEMAEVIGSIMAGNWQDDEISLFLNTLRLKSETVPEIAGAAAAMRTHMTPIRSLREGLIDTCGTGGDGSGTFNISTAAAIVTAAAGVPVAKHGNRSITSKTGSADVLSHLGVNIEASVATVERCLDEVGICFCFAPQLHASMKNVAAARKKLGVPTIFNMLGPLCNPASAPYQLLGVGKPELRPKLAQALSLLGAKRAVVVCGEDGLDEVTISGQTNVSDVRDSTTQELTWQPSDFGIEEADKDLMRVDGPEASAAMIRRILAGQAGPPRDIVVLNAAAALWTASLDQSLQACAERAASAIDSGAASDLLTKLAETSHA